MRTSPIAACLAVILSLPAAAQAQGGQTVLLDDPMPPSWDVSGHMSWLTVDKGDAVATWNRWYDVATVGASAGRFVGRHLKVEFDAATSASADVYVEHRVVVPTLPYTITYAQPARFRMTTLSGGVSYAFFDNRWFHPVVGAGLDAMRETRTIDARILGVTPPGAIPLEPPGTTVSWQNRPFAEAGFKWFVSERTFIRSNVRTTFDAGGVKQLSWRNGFGADF